MARAKKEAIILIVDIRRDESQEGDNDTTFLKAKDCARKIVLRKVLSQSPVDIGLIVLGTQQSATLVGDDIEYEHINVVRNLQPPSFGMAEDVIAEHERCPDGGDILEALVIAISMLREANPKDYAAWQIVLVSNAGGSSNSEGFDLVIEQLKKMTVQVTVIGPNIGEHSQSQDGEIAVEDMPTERSLVARLAVETDGLICRFEEALEQLTNFEKKKVRPMPWKVNFEIGPDLKLSVFGVVAVTPLEDVKAQVERKSKVDGTVVDRDHIFSVATSTDERPVDKADVINGFNFGSTIVPISADEKAAASYKSGPKSLKLLYFIEANSTPRHLMIGHTYHFFPADEPHTKVAFSSLVHAMAEENVGAIVRRVYNNNTNPTIAVLLPSVTDDYDCLVYVPLPYDNDVKNLSLPPFCTKKTKPSEDQLTAIDKLIDSMNLMEIEDEYGELVEAFCPEVTLDPLNQHLYEVFCERALRPNNPIPEPSENVRKMLTPPAILVERSKPIIDRIKELFPTQEKKPREGKRAAAADVFTEERKPEIKPPVTVAPITSIGSLNPIDNFNQLVEAKLIPFVEACSQMQRIIEKLLSDAWDTKDLEKTVPLVQAMRASCVKEDPDVFNSWLKNLKNSSSKTAYLEVLVEGKVGLITKEETEKSSISREEAEALLRDGTDGTGEMKPDVTDNSSLDDWESLINAM